MTYVITATNHGLGQTPCNINQTLFGDLGNGNAFSEVSREFTTREEAESALTTLESSGDWPDGQPDYEIEEVAR
jgi:hypothetical protein